MAKASRPSKENSDNGQAAAVIKSARAKRRKGIDGISISPEIRLDLYAQASYLGAEFKRKCGLQLPFITYFQDPFVGKNDPTQALDEKVYVAWEPGLSDGPTSSRFAIVDYNADTGVLEPPAVWDEATQTFLNGGGKSLSVADTKSFTFHQVSVWALLQRALAFFEAGPALGRTIPWAFEGNRLIVVPHAGNGENAFYDRASKSLQFYYFGSADDPVYTCLSVDIVNHEFGHAVLDGIRPLYNESSSPQTAAFHEFMGDLSAILLTLQNQTLRHQLAETSGGKFKKATTLASIAEQFGQAVKDRPYLRSATNNETMKTLANETSAHTLSQVLTGAMFDVLIALGDTYQRTDREGGPKTPRQAFYYAADRMQRMAIQPLDLLPPVEVTFRDYALAVCRSQQLSDPIDPDGYYQMLIKVFRKRHVLNKEDEEELNKPRYLTERLGLSVRHGLDDFSRSRAAAYRFLDDNREDLLIPASRDFFVADLYDAKKRGRQNLPLSRQIVLQYAWREEVPLEGAAFGGFAGRTTTMLCGGTLVFNDDGNVLSWMMKPGSLPYGGKRSRGGKTAEKWAAAVKEGEARRKAFLDHLAAQIAAGRIGVMNGSGKGFIASQVPPMTVEGDGDVIRFQLSPHLHLSEDAHEREANETGERQWQISC